MSIPRYLSSAELLVIIISHGYKKFFVLQMFKILYFRKFIVSKET